MRLPCGISRDQHLLDRGRARVYSSATAHTARAFLGEAAERLDIGSVQVDSGSEFMRHSWRSDFEDGCRERGLPPLVLSPRFPAARRHRRTRQPLEPVPGRLEDGIPIHDTRCRACSRAQPGGSSEGAAAPGARLRDRLGALVAVNGKGAAAVVRGRLRTVADAPAADVCGGVDAGGQRTSEVPRSPKGLARRTGGSDRW